MIIVRYWCTVNEYLLTLRTWNVSTMNAEIYSALIDAGASEDKAKEAAKSVADYQKDINDVKAALKLIKWGIGLIIAAEVLPSPWQNT